MRLSRIHSDTINSIVTFGRSQESFSRLLILLTETNKKFNVASHVKFKHLITGERARLYNMCITVASLSLYLFLISLICQYSLPPERMGLYARCLLSPKFIFHQIIISKYSVDTLLQSTVVYIIFKCFTGRAVDCIRTVNTPPQLGQVLSHLIYKKKVSTNSSNHLSYCDFYVKDIS